MGLEIVELDLQVLDTLQNLMFEVGVSFENLERKYCRNVKECKIKVMWYKVGNQEKLYTPKHKNFCVTISF